MFNTISKQCLLCLRLVSCGVSLLQSGFIWDGVDLTVCVPHSCFLLLETLRMCVGGGVCFVFGFFFSFFYIAKLMHCMCIFCVGSSCSPEMTEETPHPCLL